MEKYPEFFPYFLHSSCYYKNNKKFRIDKNLKLMGQVRQVVRYYHYAYRTEQTYCDWITRYIKFFNSQKHPRDMGKREIELFLSHLAVKENVAESTQRQALNAIIFLYKQVLDIPIDESIEHRRAKKHKRVPVVMTKNKVKSVIQNMKGTHLIMAKILYGSGLRLMECVRLRVQDLDFEKNIIYVRAGKGNKDRITLFPQSIQTELKNQLNLVKNIYKQDLDAGYGCVYLPNALAKKYLNAQKDFG